MKTDGPRTMTEKLMLAAIVLLVVSAGAWLISEYTDTPPTPVKQSGLMMNG
jgi:hypothetical protein